MVFRLKRLELCGDLKKTQIWFFQTTQLMKSRFFLFNLKFRTSGSFWYAIEVFRYSGSGTMQKWKFEMKIKCNM